MSFTVRLQVRRGPAEGFPTDDDDALGDLAFGRVTGAVEKGTPRPALLVLREDRVEWVDLVPVLGLPSPRREIFMAGLAGPQDAVCAGMLGVLSVSSNRRAVRAAVAYLEWPDNRWWTAWQPLDDSRKLVGDGPVVRRAVDGWPRPGGIGGWFATVRRMNLRLNVTPSDPGPAADPDEREESALEGLASEETVH